MNSSITRILDAITSRQDFLTFGCTRLDCAPVVAKLRRRLEKARVPEEVKQQMSDALKRVMAEPQDGASDDDDAADEEGSEIERLSLKRGTIVFDVGEKADECYIVHKGSVDVFYRDDEGRMVPVNRVGEGSLLGEMALIDGKPRSAGASAAENTTLIVIPKAEMDRQLAGVPPVMRSVLLMLIDKTRDIAEEMADELKNRDNLVIGV